MSFVLGDSIHLPRSAVTGLVGFRRWAKSSAFPDRGDFSYLRGDVWVRLSPLSAGHNLLLSALTTALAQMTTAARMGRVMSHGMRLVNEAAGLSCEPDAMFASRETLARGRVRLEEGVQSLEVIGTPDMVLEVVSEHSVQKDTVALRELYAAAGIAEYWLVNSLGDEPVLDILRLTAKGYASSRKVNGWVKSTVFGKSFRLEAQDWEDDLPDYRLMVK